MQQLCFNMNQYRAVNMHLKNKQISIRLLCVTASPFHTAESFNLWELLKGGVSCMASFFLIYFYNFN